MEQTRHSAAEAHASMTGSGALPEDREWPECDLVMKGGITSGVVYPKAIAEIARTFRLRSIGGTSAGAIAAACAAAAELGRQRYLRKEIPEDPQGFARLAELPTLLSERVASGRGSRLLGFFKPARSMRKAFRVFTGTLEVKGIAMRALRWSLMTLREDRIRAVATALAMTLVFAALALAIWHGGHALGVALAPERPAFDAAMNALRQSGSAALMTGLILLSLCAALLVATVLTLSVWLVLRLLRQLPGNFYGICGGMPERDDAHPEEALMPWLEGFLDALSGQDQLQRENVPRRPLTFGDMDAHGIELKMMTTSLTFGRPFRLPFGDEEAVRENGLFAAKRSDFERLFPAHVVDWMQAHPRRLDGGDFLRNTDLDGFLRMPAPEDFPVLVAVRMSLSFPLLLSAVPLYSLDRRKDQPKSPVPLELRPCWFTDGGVGSNFPIHFFDTPLPMRPTFGLDLGTASEEMGDDPEARVHFPTDNNDASLSPWWAFERATGVGAIARFLLRIVAVAKDWNHDALAVLPGFRDRICTVLLKDGEGGLNLTMPEPLIRRLGEFGEEAGRRFVAAFGPQAPDAETPRIGWANHQKIRQRMLLATMTESLLAIDEAVRHNQGTALDMQRFFDNRDPLPRSYPYRRSGGLERDKKTGRYRSQAGLSRWLLLSLAELGATLRAHVDPKRGVETPIDPRNGSPRPRPELKVRPRI
jgi:predicted acylesterase/phospholipase RssA